MSLILEALRKSEAERRVGALPDLLSPAIPVRRRRHWLQRWWWLPVLASGLAAGWWLAPRAPTAVGALDRSAPRDAATQPGGPVQTTPTGVEVRQQPAAAGPPAAPAPPPPPIAAKPPAPAPSVALVRSPVEAPAPTALPADVAPPVAAVPAAPGSVPLAQMPAAKRSGLPALKLTVHVFAEVPDRRWSLIDGRRVVEGDTLGDRVRVREIQRDGVLLDIDGQPWLLERPR